MSHTVAIFGGSFNPPHIAHYLAVAYVRAMFPCVHEVWIVPCFSHAFAKCLESFEHRVSMCELTFVSLSGVSVCRIEKQLGAPSRSVRTVRYLRKRHPQWHFRLVVGSDILTEAHQWESFDTLVELAPPIILTRAGWQLHCKGCYGACLPEVSSSQIRTYLSNGAFDLAKPWLVPSVAAYIRDHGLYASCDRPPAAPQTTAQRIAQRDTSLMQHMRQRSK